MSELSMTDERWRHEWYRLQNSPYFCVFKYVRTVKQKLWSEAENGERDWGEKSYGRVGLARFARVRLWPYTKTILRKSDCFTVDEQYQGGLGGNGSITTSYQLKFVKLYFKMPDNSTLNKKTKNYSPIPKITVSMNPQWGTKATSGVSILCFCFHWSVSVNTAHGILLDPLLQRLKWCSAGPTLRSRSLPVWIPSRICVRCFSSPGWWMRKVSVFKLL